jgi:flagellum-specific peptidoglycan hydrolase FlgJ
MTKEEFLTQAMAAARASSANSGLDPDVTVAQAALESNFGKSRLSVEANNYFGIKARHGQNSVEMRTMEVTAGKTVTVRAHFAKFESMEQCFAARDHMILTLPCYAEARACAADAGAFVRALARRWATDPKYAEKLLRVVQTCRDAACRVSIGSSG